MFKASKVVSFCLLFAFTLLNACALSRQLAKFVADDVDLSPDFAVRMLEGCGMLIFSVQIVIRALCQDMNGLRIAVRHLSGYSSLKVLQVLNSSKLLLLLDRFNAQWKDAGESCVSKAALACGSCVSACVFGLIGLAGVIACVEKIRQTGLTSLHEGWVLNDLTFSTWVQTIVLINQFVKMFDLDEESTLSMGRLLFARGNGQMSTFEQKAMDDYFDDVVLMLWRDENQTCLQRFVVVFTFGPSDFQTLAIDDVEGVSDRKSDLKEIVGTSWFGGGCCMACSLCCKGLSSGSTLSGSH